MGMLRSGLVAALLLSGSAVLAELTAQVAEPEPPDTVLYIAERGNVTFTHGKHLQTYDCKSCHHESKPEKPLETENQKCSACHTNPAAEPLSTPLTDAFHLTAKREGLCYDCHKEEAGKGTKQVPVLCADCHKRPRPSRP
jgi:hypothetical protein